MGERQVPAILKAYANTEDVMTISKVTTVKEGYMLITDFENRMGQGAVKVFPSESSARSSSLNERILKVKIEREL